MVLNSRKEEQNVPPFLYLLPYIRAMSYKLLFTQYPPKVTTLIWDGECGFCKYWKIYWEKMTADKIVYQPFQEAASNFLDIEKQTFQNAVQLIDIGGKIYSGANAVYRIFFIIEKHPYLFRWYMYNSAFRKFSDFAYRIISDNRPLMYKITIHLFGKNPTDLKPYWIIYLSLLVFLILLAIVW